ncbi:hypothetical protein OCU04_010966 [Sclerotinia nivalis]|uniref:Uncharacterized protein n=1 Tax=Sclerotinia nivalis TaxID=352851 RepID=A0A9X0AGS6_9HELO|nr:hypothetical protein OCU04_010966 [Sclerotinia nivalis]
MRDFVNKVNHTAFYRYFELINHGKVSIARAITFADEQVERWKLCPLSAFRSAATRMMEQMEHAQAKEAKRKKIPISMTAEGKQDYFDDVIQSRLQEHSQVLVMIRDAYSLSLNLSEKAWKELSKGIADSGQEPFDKRECHEVF